jgi:hypothetical protein
LLSSSSSSLPSSSPSSLFAEYDEMPCSLSQVVIPPQSKPTNYLASLPLSLPETFKPSPTNATYET